MPLVCLALHLFGNLDVDFEELGHAAVEADRLALVEIAFAVVLWNAFLGACVDKSVEMSVSYTVSSRGFRLASLLVEHVGNHLNLGLCSCDLLC